MLLSADKFEWNPTISNVTRGWPSVKYYPGKGKLEKYILKSFLEVNLQVLTEFEYLPGGICNTAY